MQAQQALTKHDLETRLIEKAWKDPEFKKQVLADPKGMFEKVLGRKLPPNMTVNVHEEDQYTLHFSLPPAPSNVSELSDQELEAVSGGTEVWFTVTIVGASMGIVSGAIAGTVGAGAAVTVSKGW